MIEITEGSLRFLNKSTEVSDAIIKELDRLLEGVPVDYAVGGMAIAVENFLIKVEEQSPNNADLPEVFEKMRKSFRQITRTRHIP